MMPHGGFRTTFFFRLSVSVTTLKSPDYRQNLALYGQMAQAPAKPADKAVTVGSLSAADTSAAASDSISDAIVSSKSPVKVVCVSGR